MAITFAHAGATTVTLDDGVNFWVLNEGVNLGEPVTTWDEVVNYAATANVQTDVVARKALVPVTIPMRVKGSSVANLQTQLAKIWAVLDLCTYASPGTLTWGSETFSIVYSSRPAEIIRDPQYQLGFNARFTLTLTRMPA